MSKRKLVTLMLTDDQKRQTTGLMKKVKAGDLRGDPIMAIGQLFEDRIVCGIANPEESRRIQSFMGSTEMFCNRHGRIKE